MKGTTGSDMYARIMILPSWMFLSKTPWRTGWHTGHTLPLNVVRVNRGRRGSHSLRSPQNYGMNELHEFFSASCFPVLPSWSVSNLQTFLYLPDIFLAPTFDGLSLWHVLDAHQLEEKYTGSRHVLETPE